jgi:hypothetical protein
VELTLINLGAPTETRTFEKGRFDVYRAARRHGAGDGAGDFVSIPPGHDSWVVGEEPYVSLHVMGGEDYAT